MVSRAAPLGPRCRLIHLNGAPSLTASNCLYPKLNRKTQANGDSLGLHLRLCGAPFGPFGGWAAKNKVAALLESGENLHYSLRVSNAPVCHWTSVTAWRSSCNATKRLQKEASESLESRATLQRQPSRPRGKPKKELSSEGAGPRMRQLAAYKEGPRSVCDDNHHCDHHHHHLITQSNEERSPLELGTSIGLAQTVQNGECRVESAAEQCVLGGLECARLFPRPTAAAAACLRPLCCGRTRAALCVNAGQQAGLKKIISTLGRNAAALLPSVLYWLAAWLAGPHLP